MTIFCATQAQQENVCSKLEPGKWYITDAWDYFFGPMDTKEDAQKAVDNIWTTRIIKRDIAPQNCASGLCDGE